MQVTAGLDRTVCMALKTVNADRCIGMTTVAEMLFTADTWRIRCITDMTIDALDQAVLLVANAFVHRFIALVENILHVVHAHVLSFLYAALCLAETVLGFRNIGQQAVCHGCCKRGKQRSQGKDNETCISHRQVSSLC